MYGSGSIVFMSKLARIGVEQVSPSLKSVRLGILESILSLESRKIKEAASSEWTANSNLALRVS